MVNQEANAGVRPEGNAPVKKEANKQQPKKSHKVRNIILGTAAAGAITGTIFGVQSLRNNDNQGSDDKASGQQATPKTNEAPGIPSSKSSFVPYESLGGVPFYSSEFRGNVSPDEIMVITGGPMSVSVKDEKENLVTRTFEGGIDKGTIIIFVGANKTNPVNVSGLELGANWFGKYRPENAPLKSWPQIMANSIINMQKEPNCTSGKGCKNLDWIIINADSNKVIGESGKQNPSQSNQVPGTMR